jgi:hypothetical protein
MKPSLLHLVAFAAAIASAQTVAVAHEAADSIDFAGQTTYPAYSDRVSLGDGHLRSFALHYRDGTPFALGVEFSAAALKNLPTEPNDGLNCWDLNGDHAIDLHEECSGGHNRILFFGKNNSPFKWLSVDWEPHGHVPEDTYGARHFDFHFYMTDIVERNSIAVGPCMPGTIDCEQYKTAIKPVLPQYIHADFFNTNLAFSRMGNHWADKTSPEFNGQKFTNTFILGSYDARITFYEPMLSLDYLLSKPVNDCRPIKQPSAYQQAGYYPTSYCVRYHKAQDKYTISLERFVKRQAN